MCVCAWIFVCVCMCMCVCVHICVHLQRYIQILHVFIYLYIYMCAKYSDFLCIWLRKCDFLTEKLGIGRIRIRNDLFRIRIHNTSLGNIIRDVYPGSRILIFFSIKWISYPGVKKALDPGSLTLAMSRDSTGAPLNALSL